RRRSAALLIAEPLAAAEWVPMQHRARALSWALIGPPAAWIVGMPLIGVIGEIGWRWAWLVFPLAAAGMAGVTVARRPEAPPGAPAASLVAGPHDPPTARWVLGELFGAASWVGTLVFSGALFTESYGVTSVVTGLVLAAGAAAFAAGNVYFRRLVECRARAMIVRLSLLLAVGIALFGIVRPELWVSALLFAAARFVAGGRQLVGSAVGLESAPERRRAVVGARAAGTQLGYFVGAAVGGAAVAAGGYSLFGLVLALLSVASALPFLVHVHGHSDTTLRAALL